MGYQTTIFDDATINLDSVAEDTAEEVTTVSKLPLNTRHPSRLGATALRGDLVHDGSTTLIAIAAISCNPWQPRCHIDSQELQSLANSIGQFGLLQPIVVRRTPMGKGESYYQLVAGERRYRAMALLGHEEIPAVVVDVSDPEIALMALVENLEREDLSDYEIGKAIRGIEENFPSRRELSAVLRMDRREFYRYLVFEKLPAEVLADLEKDGRLMSRKTADDLARILNRHGQAASEKLLGLWPKVRTGEIEHPKLAGLVEAMLMKRPANADRIVKKLFSQDSHAGTITRDATGFSLRIKSSAISDEQSESLGQYVLVLLDATIK
jgi:ParB family chromosome partitioning protein